ncbi:MAG: biotin/lipoyl-binding protein, partial [Oscillochloris sp.]|nr:biotin/lipoyl-binding protein [Oscillochloris sp.]
MTPTTIPKRRRRFRWPTVIFILILILTILCVAGVFIARYFLVGRDSANPSVIIQVVPVEQGDLSEVVEVNGSLEPRDRSSVSFTDGVRVREVLVREGDHVQAGQPLARLESRDLELKVASAQAELDQAQRTLDKLNAGPTKAELAQAAAAVASARANLVSADDDVRQVDIDIARARRDEARQRLADLEAGVATDDLKTAEKQSLAAQDTLRESQDNLEKIRDSASQAKTTAQLNLERGAQALVTAQRAYSDAYWDWDYVQRTGRHPSDKITDPDTGRETHRELEDDEVDQFQRTLEEAEITLKNAEQDLTSLQDAYDLAREDEVSQVNAAQRQIDTATRDLADAQQVFETARTKGMATAVLDARKTLADAEKAYTDLVDNPKRPADRAVLEAAV